MAELTKPRVCESCRNQASVQCGWNQHWPNSPVTCVMLAISEALPKVAEYGKWTGLSILRKQRLGLQGLSREKQERQLRGLQGSGWAVACLAPGWSGDSTENSPWVAGTRAEGTASRGLPGFHLLQQHSVRFSSFMQKMWSLMLYCPRERYYTVKIT